MGFIDDKKNIFTQIGALTSIKDEFSLPDLTNSLSSINNTKEIVPLLLDMLTVLVGSDALRTATGEIMTNFIRSVEPSLKNELKRQVIDFNSNQTVPAGFVAGYSMPAKDIDSFGKLRNDPSSQLGSLLYNNNTNDFDVRSYDAIVVAGSDVTFNNITINYNETLDEFTYKPTNSFQTIGQFSEEYIDGLTIIDESEFISKVINNLFGTVTTNEEKTLENAILEDKIDLTLQKIIDEDESIIITDDELRSIQTTAENRINGINELDIGCGIIDSVVTLDNLQNLISGTTGNTDPLTVGNAYQSLINDSFSSNNETLATDNANTINDGFFKRLINAIVSILVNSVTSTPQIRALLAIIGGFKNNDTPFIGNPISDLQNRKELITCLSNNARSSINEFLFELVKIQLINLIIPVSKIILREKINQFLAIIRSLIPFG